MKVKSSGWILIKFVSTWSLIRRFLVLCNNSKHYIVNKTFITIVKHGYGYYHSVTLLVEGIQKDKDILQAFKNQGRIEVSNSLLSKILDQYSIVIMILSKLNTSREDILEILDLLPEYTKNFSHVGL